jgi:hypothetical protein
MGAECHEARSAALLDRASPILELRNDRKIDSDFPVDAAGLAYCHIQCS